MVAMSRTEIKTVLRESETRGTNAATRADVQAALLSCGPALRPATKKLALGTLKSSSALVLRQGC